MSHRNETGMIEATPIWEDKREKWRRRKKKKKKRERKRRET